jgi:hypothetical protein
MERCYGLGIVVLATALLGGCAVQTGYDEEEVELAPQSLINGVAGTKTGLVAKFNFDGGRCSGVLVPTGSTARWLITAQHCVGAAEYDATTATVTTQDTTVYGVDAIYQHPEGEWGLTGFDLGDGDPDGTGKVDMILVRLSSNVPIAAADRNMFFSTDNATINTYHESIKDDGATSYSWVSASISPDPDWPVRATTTAGLEDGDSGGPVWSKASIDAGGRLYQGLHSSPGSVTDSSSYYRWAIDAINFGAFDINNPSATFCSTSHPCGAGEGDCDSDAECKSGLSCRSNTGPTVGLPADYDVCLEVLRQPSNTEGFCESIGGCQLYEGDCNSHAGCKDNLVCRADVGAAVGLSATKDVCDLPRVPGWTGTNRAKSGGRLSESSNWCTPTSPCSLGDGDCNENDHSTCRGYLRCKANVGNQFGFVNNAVDVCVHPDFL